LSSSFDNAVQVWNPETREIVEEHLNFSVPISAIRFQGNLIVAELGNEQGAARIFNGVAVGPSGAIYITGDVANVLYRIEPKS
jgi:glucose/arabinose dehydrogenase